MGSFGRMVAEPVVRLEGVIEVAVSGTGVTYRPGCQCGWVGLTTIFPKDAAIHFDQHRGEAHR